MKINRNIDQNRIYPFPDNIHSIQYSKPSLVCDLQEPFRPSIIEFLIDWSQDLEEDDFEKNGERVFLKEEKGYDLIQSVNVLLDTKIEHQRIKEFGDKSKIRTIIKEEPLKLGQYLRGDKEK